ncbi:6-phosphogluconolactonase [Sideroxydans sp.]
MSLHIHRFPAQDWAASSAELIQLAVLSVLHEKPECCVVLTGGRSAAKMYAEWSGIPSFQRLRNVAFCFGDERCVEPENSESNYGMAMNSLFARGVPHDCQIFRMEADADDIEAATARYETKLPNNVDVLILGVGEDGHIASLFPHDGVLGEHRRKVVAINNSPKPPAARMTITPDVVVSARQVFILALGKSNVLERAMVAPLDIDVMPVRLAATAHWLLEEEENDGKN